MRPEASNIYKAVIKLKLTVQLKQQSERYSERERERGSMGQKPELSKEKKADSEWREGKNLEQFLNLWTDGTR